MVSFLSYVRRAGGKFPSMFFSWLCSQSAGKKMCQSPNKAIWIYVLVPSLTLSEPSVFAPAPEKPNTWDCLYTEWEKKKSL